MEFPIFFINLKTLYGINNVYSGMQPTEMLFINFNEIK